MLLALLSIAAAWAISALVILGAFAATSYDDFTDLVEAAMRSAVPAVWLVPAFLFIQGPGIPGVLFGLVLLANAVRLLVSARPPRRLNVKAAAGKQASYEWDAFLAETTPIIGSAFLLQTGIAAAVLGFPVIGALLVTCGTAVIAWWWSSAARLHGNPAPLWKRATAVTVAAALTILQIQTSSSPKIAEARPTAPSYIPLTTEGVNPKDIRPLPGKELVPGVILRPKRKEPKIEPLAITATTRRGIFSSGASTLKFTGEYHLFPASSRRVQPDSTVLEGTPLDAAYVSLSGGEIETEAYQPFQPPVDLTGCGRILIRLKYNERSPASATLHLVTTTGALELETEIFGLDSSNNPLLEYTVPGVPANLLVKAIRVVFQRDPFHRTQSARIAIDEFTFLPLK